MSRSSDDSRAEDAMRRLVRAMVGREQEEATSLARRVLGSHIGSSQEDSSGRFGDQSLHHADLSATWRRISRRASDPQCRMDVESLYGQLEQFCDERNEGHLPPRVLTVLTKLMGKHLRLPEPSSVVATTSSSLPRSVVSTPLPTNLVQPEIPIEKAASPTDKLATEHQIREEKKELETEEALLLRECLYSLQGISGERIRYFEKSSKKQGQSPVPEDNLNSYEGVRIQSAALSHSLLYTGRVLETRLGSGAMDALRISGEAGWLYHRIQNYIHQVQQDDSKGVVARAFAGTLAEELREYHSLLTKYESQLGSLTLRQLLVDLRMPTARLKTLALLTDGLSNLSGGNLLSALYQHSLHGDTRHVNLVQTMLQAASRPWFDMLYSWTTQGVLSDPHKEFFVVEHEDVGDRTPWQDRYAVNSDQIPTGILDNELVGPAFNVGMGIIFIRRCLEDAKWTMHLESIDEDTTEDGGNNDLGYRYKPYSDGNVELQRTLSRAASMVHTHILRTLTEENHMMKHLFALKQFLFLGQGDFFSTLVDGMHSEFRDQVGVAGINKHTLLAIVEAALRSTNAKRLPPYALDRLQVELLLDPDDDSFGMFGAERREGERNRTVWDIFMLDYKIPDPLTAIVHPAAMEKYKMIFSLLFGLKKVEFMLNYTWRQSATLQHALQNYAHYNDIRIGSSEAYALASLLLRKISILRQSMTHLIVNLKSYLMFEVTEGGWRRLDSDIQLSKTLDDVIQAHDRYIDGIVRKSLLYTSSDGDTEQQLAGQVQTLLQITDDFCDLQEGLFRSALSAADIAARKRMEADRRTSSGRWGFDSEQDITEEERFFGLADSTTLREVSRISKLYNANAVELLKLLTEKVNGNQEAYNQDSKVDRKDDSLLDTLTPNRRVPNTLEDDLDPQRFLVAQLDHNGFYGQWLKEGVKRRL